MSITRIEFGDFFFSFVHEYDKLERQLCRMTNLYSGQPRILTMLMTKDPVSLKELSSMTNLGMPSLSVSIRNLEKSGLVIRQKGITGDNRTCLISLTPEGRHHAEQFHELIHAYFMDIEDAFKPQNTAYITDIMKRLNEVTINYQNKLQP